MISKKKATLIFFWLWVILSLIGLFYHEVWRDEAQAWLVASSSGSLADLLLRSSIEATGPVYYLLIWPFTKLWPLSFPISIQIISWIGTFFAAYVWTFKLSFSRNSVRILGLFSFYFLYEFSAIARLYGWGLFFLFLGFYWLKQERRIRAQVVFALAMLTQSIFAISAAVLLLSFVYRELRYPRVFLRKNWIFVLSGTLAVIHFMWGRPYHPWIAPSHDFLKVINNLGNSICYIFFANLGKPGGFGIFFAFLLFLIPQKGVRYVYLGGILLFASIFVVAYRGYPLPRHCGPLFLVFMLLADSEHLSSLKNKLLHLLLFYSFVFGIYSWAQEINTPFGDAEEISEVIKKNKCSGKPLRLFTDDDFSLYAAAALLSAEVWNSNGPVGCPFFPGTCEIGRKSNVPVTLPDVCKGFSCFWVQYLGADSPSFSSQTKVQLIYKTEHHLLSDERFKVFQIACAED